MKWIIVGAAVPSDRVEEFYGHHAEWLSQLGAAPAADDSVDLQAWGDDERDVEAAAAVWDKLSDRAQGLMAVFMQEPGRKFAAPALAEQLDIPNGMFGVAGVLAWPKRHAAKVGRPLPVSFEYGQPGEGANYWMEPAVAAVFQRAVGQEAQL